MREIGSQRLASTRNERKKRKNKVEEEPEASGRAEAQHHEQRPTKKQRPIDKKEQRPAGKRKKGGAAYVVVKLNDELTYAEVQATRPFRALSQLGKAMYSCAGYSQLLSYWVRKKRRYWNASATFG